MAQLARDFAVVVRHREQRGRALGRDPRPRRADRVGGISLVREAGPGIHQQVIPSLLAYRHDDDRVT
jgi:hypothetical protein